MKPELTAEERKLLHQMKSPERWGHLTYDLTVMIPCFIIMSLGLYSESTSAVIIGMLVYFVITIRKAVHSDKIVRIMKSLMGKIDTEE